MRKSDDTWPVVQERGRCLLFNWVLFVLRAAAIPSLLLITNQSFSAPADSATAYDLDLADLPSTTTDPNSFRIEEVAGNLRVPWSIAFTADGRLFFTERPGRLRIIENGILRAEPLLTIDECYNDGKMGLLGMALHPSFNKNHWLYLAYCYTSDKSQVVRVVRYTETSGTLADRKNIIDSIPAAPSHAGCRVAFGPDSKLYITTGDAGKGEIAQQLESLGGKTLRLNDNGTIPPDNPFVKTQNARPEIWTFGHRNAQGITFQPETGIQFQSEHGPSGFDGPCGGDEINIIERGKNYGWPIVHHRKNQLGLEPPILEYTPSVAPGSAMIYNGKAFPQFRGNLFVGCLGGQAILRIVLDNKIPVAQERLFHKTHGRIREVAEAPDGTIYFTTSQHDIEIKHPAPGTDRIMRLVPNPAFTSDHGSTK